jgi:hypothetical protein
MLTLGFFNIGGEMLSKPPEMWADPDVMRI